MVDAGEFSAWLRGMTAALRGDGESDVPCGTCSACCRSAQFVHIEPDETATLARVPRSLLFPAPHLPRGHLVMGYDENGCCPMLGPAGCTIYADRPRACRVYDCRIFAAAGIEPADKPLVAERVAQWRWESPSPEQDAVRAAATYLRSHPDLVAPDAPSAAQALAALHVYDLFLDGAQPTPAVVRQRLADV